MTCILKEMMKNYYFKIYVALHLLFIVCICTISTYDSYCEFYRLKKDSGFIKQVAKILNPNLVQIYGKISGCDAGYGFYAPNVRSSGIIILENAGVKYSPEFKSLEAGIRFSTFESTISNHLLENDTLVRNKSEDSLFRAYNDLLFKAIAVKLMNENKIESKNSVITYNLYENPSLKMYRGGVRKPVLQKLYQQELSLKTK